MGQAQDFCISCGHYHKIICTKCKNEHGGSRCDGKNFTNHCSLFKGEWDCKCSEKGFVRRSFKGQYA